MSDVAAASSASADVPHSMQSIGAVLVEFRSNGATAEAARSALDLGLAVAVADNSGTYGGGGLVLRTSGNIGFGAACNAAVRLLPPHVDTLVLWNPDAQIDPAGLATLVRAVHEGGWTAVAPSVEGAGIRRLGFSYPSVLREGWITAREVRWLRRGRPQVARDVLEPEEETGRHPVTLDRRFGTAAMLVVDRAAFEAIGGFDERYFLYVEDLDLWDRLVAAGGRCGFLPSVRARHLSAAGSEASADRRTVLRWLGVESYIEARHARRWRLYRAVHSLGLRLLPRSDDELVEAMRAGVRNGRTPSHLQSDVRSVALGRGLADSTVALVGWARTRVVLAARDLVLDVGSGAFPNPRADVLCERSPLRTHRTAVIDRPFVVADAQALPFRSGAFDFVVASHLAEHVDDPLRFCAELDRVARSGYLETPSPRFERVFPERNHLWMVRSLGNGRLRFEVNSHRHASAGRLGRLAYRWYYAGQTRDRPTIQPGSMGGRLVGWVALILRGGLNRLGVTVTRCRFDGTHRLRAEVER